LPQRAVLARAQIGKQQLTDYKQGVQPVAPHSVFRLRFWGKKSRGEGIDLSLHLAQLAIEFVVVAFLRHRSRTALMGTMPLLPTLKTYTCEFLTLFLTRLTFVFGLGLHWGLR